MNYLLKDKQNKKLLNEYFEPTGKPKKCIYCDGGYFYTENRNWLTETILGEYDLFCEYCNNYASSFAYGGYYPFCPETIKDILIFLNKKKGTSLMLNKQQIVLDNIFNYKGQKKYKGEFSFEYRTLDEYDQQLISKKEFRDILKVLEKNGNISIRMFDVRMDCYYLTLKEYTHDSCIASPLSS